MAKGRGPSNGSLTKFWEDLMRLIAAVIASATLILAAPAFARDKAWYVGVEGGPMHVPEIKFDIGGVRPAADARQDTGFDVDGIVGYDFGTFRLEAEVGYRESGLREYTSLVPIPAEVPAFAPAGTYRDVAGSTSALSFMINGMLDFGDEDGVWGFVGGGVGVARTKLAEYRLRNTAAFLETEQDTFAWQLVAGVRKAVSKRVDLGLKYRYFQTGMIEADDRAGRQNRFGLATHSLLFGFTYNFGAPPSPPPAPPEPNPNPTAPVM